LCIRDIASYLKLTFVICIFYPAAAFSIPGHSTSVVAIGGFVLFVGLVGSVALWRTKSFFLGVQGWSEVRFLSRSSRLRGLLFLVLALAVMVSVDLVVSSGYRVPEGLPGLPDAKDTLAFLLFAETLSIGVSALVFRVASASCPTTRTSRNRHSKVGKTRRSR